MTLVDVGPGDEVVLPSFTFASVASAVVARGGVPVFVDVRADTFNLDERLLADAISPRTRAVVAVHYAGVACEMDALHAICDQVGVALVEDNAHGLGGTYRDRPLGSLGVLAAQSFHVTKNVQCGEGGALVVNDPGLLGRAEVLREKGTNRTQMTRGQVDKYTWLDAGSSYLLSDLLAAVLCSQLDDFDEIQRRRHEAWKFYDAGLSDWRIQHGVDAQRVPPDRSHSAHGYGLVMPSEAARDALIEHLGMDGIAAASHYVPLHSSPAGSRFGRTPARGCPVSERVSACLLRLPLHSELEADQLEQVVAAVERFVVRDTA
jgi:dTDP-4-amino-4,6-dideoxygalactose transaminase